jgi:hypothetical protein
MPSSPTSAEERLGFSRRDRVGQNTEALITATGGGGPSPQLTYFEALNRVQGRPVSLDGIEDTPRRIYRFSDPEDLAILAYFLEEDPRPSHFYEGEDRQRIERRLEQGLQLLDAFDPSTISLLESLVARILFARKRGFGGASAGDMLGCVWLSPPESWGAADFAEALYHESLHQALFLEEMTRGVYRVDTATMSAPEGLVVSAIRRERRPFAASFHAAAVAAGLIDLYRFLDQPDRVESLVEGLRPSVEEMFAKRELLDQDGEEILDEIRLRVS